MSWIKEIVQAYSESESPERFYYWSALTVLAAGIKKNIYLDRHYYHLYPNIYVFIYAKSGMKKGPPVAFASSLMEKAGIRTIEGRASMPAILQILGKQFTSPNGTVTDKAQAAIISGEFSSFLVKDPDAIPILTSLYNAHEHEKIWKNQLKVSGVDSLKEPCITVLGATNDEYLTESIPEKDTKGGFIARTMVVHSNDRVKVNSLVHPPKNIINIDKFLPYLECVMKLQGEFKWTPETGDFFHDWYTDFKATALNDPLGYSNRIDDTIIRVAILLSLAKRPVLEMDMDCLKEAKAECLRCMQDAQNIFMGSGKATYSAQTRIVMQELLDHPDHKLTKMQILRQYWGDIDQNAIDMIAETLYNAGVIEIQHKGRETIYEMKQSVVDEYKRYL